MSKLKLFIIKYKFIFLTIISTFLLLYIGFLQYSDFNYVYRVKQIKREIISLNLKINKLENNETTFDSDLESGTKELNGLKETLSKLENDLIEANKKLNYLK